MAGLGGSVFALLRGVVARFIYWLPFIILDISDYWEKYIRPGILHFTGKDVVMPSGALLVGAAVGITWSGILTYHELRTKKLEQDEELSPSVEIDPMPSLQEWTDSGKLCRAFYITIRNPSAKPLRAVSVYLTDVSPRVPNLDWLPIPLRIKHDNQPPYHDSFDMNPRGMRHIDLVSHMTSQAGFTIQHSVVGVNADAPVNTYVLTVRAEGASITAPYQSKFLVKLDHLGKLICLPASFIDLDKGLLEFNHDADAALLRIKSTIQRMTSIALQITAVLTAVTENIEAAQKTPIRWYEQLVGINTLAERMRRHAPIWAKPINRVTENLKTSVDLYVSQSEDAMQNLIGLRRTGARHIGA